ncbi:MAG: chorismate-binding protein [Nannocystaceae bacterium]
MTSAVASQPHTPPRSSARSVARVGGVDAWDYLPLADAEAVAFAWSRGPLRLLALGEAAPGEGPSAREWPGEFGGRSFTGAPGRDEWAGWPGSWRVRPRVLYASRGAGEVWRLGDGRAPAEPPPPAEPWRAIDPAAFAPVEGLDAWVAATTAATTTIRAGAAEKIVLARREVAAAPGVGRRGAALLPLLRQQSANAVTFGVKLGGELGWFVGATPETLVELEDGWLRTEALAGTHADPAGLDNAKDRGEHQWVVDGIAEALAPVSVGLEQLGPEAKRAGHLYHWQTRFRGRVRMGHGLFDLADRLQPTPAVGGTPRPAALRFIAEHEPRDRGWYAGVVGMSGASGDGHAVVALRSALLRGDAAYVYAGAGIVAASEPTLEWQETAAKLETCKRALACGGLAASRGDGS